MSAQAGIWNLDGRPVDLVLLGQLSSAIEQLGPDGGDAYADGAVGMVYRAFHTTPESRLEHQPYRSARGNVITWDGRLDNRNELRRELSAALDGEGTDVAIVGAAFEKWGTDCFRRLVGDWAVSIWVRDRRELILAVDYMAIRHIFYYPKGERIWWSTDLTPLVLLSGDKFHIDDDFISGYFANDPDAHLTPYQEIREVPPGQFVRVRNNTGPFVHRYWSYSPKARIRYKTDAEYEEHFAALFREAVGRRLRSDTPILAELSGGLDSSSIVCMADDILLKTGVQTPRLDTLSVYDKSEPRGDDWIYFPKVEEKRGRAGAHIDASKLGSSPTSLEQPDFRPLPGYFGARGNLEAERAAVVRGGKYRVVLSGIGGDEFLGGIPDPRAQLADLIVQFKFVTLAHELMAWSLIKRWPWVQLLWQASVGLLPTSLCEFFTKQESVESWIEKNFAKRTNLATRLWGPKATFGLVLPTRRSFICGVLMMANKVAKWMSPILAMEEVRYPYLDQNLIEFLLSIPATQLLRPGERRSLMRRSLVGLVPKEILSRRTKQFGERTAVVALEKNWQELRTALDSPLSSALGYINQHRFLEKLHAARSGKDIHIVRMIRTISLEFWLRDLAARGLIDWGAVPASLVPAISRQVHAQFGQPKAISITSASEALEHSEKGGKHNELQQAGDTSFG